MRNSNYFVTLLCLPFLTNILLPLCILILISRNIFPARISYWFFLSSNLLHWQIGDNVASSGIPELGKFRPILSKWMLFGFHEKVLNNTSSRSHRKCIHFFRNNKSEQDLVINTNASFWRVLTFQYLLHLGLISCQIFFNLFIFIWCFSIHLERNCWVFFIVGNQIRVKSAPIAKNSLWNQIGCFNIKFWNLDDIARSTFFASALKVKTECFSANKSASSIVLTFAVFQLSLSVTQPKFQQIFFLKKIIDETFKCEQIVYHWDPEWIF